MMKRSASMLYFENNDDNEGDNRVPNQFDETERFTVKEMPPAGTVVDAKNTRKAGPFLLG